MFGNVIQADIEEMIRLKKFDELRAAMCEIDPPDLAEAIVDLPPADEGVVFRVLPRDLGAQVFSYLPLDHQEELARSLSNAQVHAILNEMSPDDRMRLLEELPAPLTRQLLSTLSPE